jgi:YD repeat-containing protein
VGHKTRVKNLSPFADKTGVGRHLCRQVEINGLRAGSVLGSARLTTVTHQYLGHMAMNTRHEILHPLIITGLFAFAPSFASAAVPAFPGAQGGGAVSVGGRGGQVIEVTNLNDSGAGSLRACVQASGPRTCVFRVGGTINLLSTLFIRNPYLTIAGQTAPGGGIQLSGKNMPQTMMTITTNNVVIRYIRVRKGYNSSCFNECGAGILGFPSANNVMIDHVSLQWTQDEGMGVGGGTSGTAVKNWTFSYNLSGEGIRSVDEMHSTGYGLLGSKGQAADMTNIDLHHNLTMNNSHRNPLIRIKSSRLVNNLWYNSKFRTTMISGGVAVDLIGNKYKRGPVGGSAREITAFAGLVTHSAPGTPSMFLSGNVGFSQSNPAGDQYLMANESSGEGGANIGPVPSSWRRTSALANTTYPIIAESVGSIEASILPIVGASRRLDCSGAWVGNRDAHDTKMVNEYTTNTGTNVLHPSEVGYGGFPSIASGTACPDADHDGMPDVWETSRGLNPNNAADRNAVAASGYTNLEVYLAGTGSGTTPPPPPPPPSGDTTPPTVSIAAPVNGSTVSGSAVTVSANASDNVGVASVDFKADGATLFTDTTSPYATVWNTTTATNAPHTLTALARDAAGNVTTSTAVSVTVNNVSPPPPPPTTNKFVIGDRVQATASMNVRGTPGGTLLYTQPMDALGTVIAGPTQTPNGVIWWQMDYDSGTDGWSGEDNLVKYTPPAGLVAAYKFEEASGSTVVDASGKGNTGTISGASRITQGRFGKALSFDGIDDWVTVNDASALDLTTGMTLEAWVYPTVDMTQWATVILKEQPGGTLYELHANGDQSQPLTSVTVGGRHRVLSGGPWLLANQWTHLAATYDGTIQRLYINGTQVAQRSQTGPIQVSSSPLRMGGNSVWGEFFQGRIDEVRVYNRALNATDIQTDMNRSVPR